MEVEESSIDESESEDEIIDLEKAKEI